jgi:sugar lactone lactonase YvrE
MTVFIDFTMLIMSIRAYYLCRSYKSNPMMNRWWPVLCSILMYISCSDSNTTTPGSKLEPVFSDSVYQLTGVAVSKDGRLFTNYPLWSDIYRYAVVETKPGNQVSPYPDAAMNSWQPGEPGKDKWVCVQAVYIDDANRLWVVDPASPKMQGVYQQSYKLVQLDPGTGAVVKSYFFDGVADDKSYINDVRIDTATQFAYLTNSSEGGIIVVNLQTGLRRQVLQSHYSVKSDPAYTFIVDGHELRKNGQPAKFNSDGIALSPNRDWLYYKPLSDDKLYRIQTAYLRDSSLDEATLESKVQDLGHFTTSDGMIFDHKGNLYLGDIEKYRIVRIDSTMHMTTLVQDSALIWPDSYHITADNYLYVSCSQIQKQPDYNNGVNLRTKPYMIYRIKL